MTNPSVCWDEGDLVVLDINDTGEWLNSDATHVPDTYWLTLEEANQLFLRLKELLYPDYTVLDEDYIF